ncbi:hypothetical protein J6590_107508 [Homalodisca vitripennis]|nr:hypothetical protein J6590_107508 [Homalodisca vitripennis]
MDQWSGADRAVAVRAYYKNGDSVTAAQRGRVPSSHAISSWVRNFEETGSALKKKPPGRIVTVRTPENDAVRVTVVGNRRIATLIGEQSRPARAHHIREGQQHSCLGMPPVWECGLSGNAANPGSPRPGSAVANQIRNQRLILLRFRLARLPVRPGSTRPLPYPGSL